MIKDEWSGSWGSAWQDTISFPLILSMLLAECDIGIASFLVFDDMSITRKESKINKMIEL